MAIYKLTKDALTALAETELEAVGVLERKDLQQLLRSQIKALDSDLMVISEEFGDWVESSRRIAPPSGLATFGFLDCRAPHSRTTCLLVPVPFSLRATTESGHFSCRVARGFGIQNGSLRRPSRLRTHYRPRLTRATI